MVDRRAAGLLALGTAACSATVTSERLRGDAAVEGSAACRWSLADDLDHSVVVSDPPEERRFRLLDAVPTPDGALVAWRERNPDGRSDQVRVRRLQEDATPHPWSAPGRGSRAAVVTLAVSDPLQFSMVWEGPRDGVAMLAGGPTDRGECVFARFLGDNSQAWQTVALGSLMGFSLAGCGSLARAADGYSFLTGEVRALWGDELVFLSSEGRFAGSPTRLPMTSQPSVGPITRRATADGFLATWVQPGAGSARAERELHVRRFDARGAAAGDDVVVAGPVGNILDPQAFATASGALALWRSFADPARPDEVPEVRPLGVDARPAGPAAPFAPALAAAAALFVDATTRGSEVIAVATGTSASGPRLYFLPLTDRGELRGAALAMRAGQRPFLLGVAKVVPTPRGALLVFEADLTGTGGRIFAVPVDCLR